MSLFNHLRALQVLFLFIADQITEPIRKTKTGAAILNSVRKRFSGKSSLPGWGHIAEKSERKAGKKRRSRRGICSGGVVRWVPILFLPTCFVYLFVVMFRSGISEVTHEVSVVTHGVSTVTHEVYERAGHSIETLAATAQRGRKALADEFRTPAQVEIRTVEVPAPLETFDEEDFLSSEVPTKGRKDFVKNGGVKKEWGEGEAEKLRAINDKYWLAIWRLDAEFRRSAMDKMQIPIVNLPPVERDSDALCDFSASEVSDTPRPDRTVYDIFLFKDERDLLEIRVHELQSVVDWFVIVQCPITFMNRTVELVDPISIPGVADYKHKIKQVICDLKTYPLEETSPWKREAHMRNVALDSILDVSRDDDVILYGDLDEMPSRATVEKVVRFETAQFPVVMQMPLYRTNFGCLDRKLYGKDQWAGTVATTGRLVRSREPPFHENGNQLRWELRGHGTNVIKCSGWHCSSCMDVSTIIGKLSEYSHADEIGSDQKDPDILMDEIESCHFGLWKRTRTWKGLPAYVVANAERFAYLMPR